MGRTNYSLNEMLNAVTKRAFNRNTPQTVDYQHLEATTTTPGLVSNRRPYSTASILANQFSLNAQNIVESNYDPFLKILLNDEIVEKTIPVLGQTNTDRMSYAISCTDDRKFMAITSKFDEEVKVYEFNETLDTQQVISSSGTIDISGMDVDINRDGSETFVLKRYGGNIVIDKFNQSLSLVSSTVLFTYSVSVGGYLNVSEDGNRVFTHYEQISRIYDGLVTGSYYALTISDTSLKSVMSRNGRIVVVSYDVIPVSPIVTTSTLVYDDQNVNTTFTGTLRGAHVVTGSTGSYAYRDTTNQYIRLTTNALNGIGTAYWQLTSGSNWTATFELYIVNDANLGTDMRFIFFAPDNLDYTDMAEDTYSAFTGSHTHGGHYIKYAYTPTSSTHSASLLDNTDSNVTSATGINLQINGWMPITVTYVDGLLTSVMKFANGGTGYTTTHDFGTTLNSHHDVPRYFGFSGRADYNSGHRAEKRVRNINIVKNTTTYPVAIPSRNETYELPATSPTGGSVAVQAVGSQNLGVTNFDLSYDGKVMVKGHSNTVIYIWNGIEWKVFQTIVTGLSGSVSVAISEYAEYFVVASSAQIKVYKLNNVYEQYGTTINGDFGSSGHKISISKTGDKVVLGNSQMTSSNGRVYIYSLFDGKIWTIVEDLIGSGHLGKYVRISNNGDKIVLGSDTQLSVKTSGVVNTSTGWKQRGNTISTPETNDGFGRSLSLSNDGTYLAIGIPESTRTIDGTQSTGSAKIYKFSGNSWSQHGQELLGDDHFGKYTSITSNGSKVAIGSDKNSVVQVYDDVNSLSDWTLRSTITVSGATIDMGDLRLSDSGDRLFVMSGDEKVRVYDSTHTQETEKGDVRNFSITKDGSSMVLTSDTGLTEVFNRSTSTQVWFNQSIINADMTGGGATVDINNDGTSIVLVGSSDSLRLYKLDGGSWSLANSTSGQYGSSVFITDTNDIVLGNSTNAGSVKTFEIRGVFQDTTFNAPTLSLNGDTNNRINFGTPYIELGATVTTNASTIPEVEISGAVFNDENGVYSLKYEAEDLLRKKADPIYRTVEVLPKLATIKLEGASVIYHTLRTSLADPGVTTSIPVTIYHTTPSDSTSIVPDFPNFVTATTVGEYKIYYTNDTPDKYLRLTTPTKRSVHVRARPVLSLVGASTVYNPLGQEYTDSGASSTGTVSFNKPNVQLSQTQTVTYTAKDQFGIEAIPITREVIVRKRPTITTSGTLYRIRNDPITIPSPTIDPTELTSSLQSSNNIREAQNGTYTISYNVTDGDGIPANTTRQSYNVGSYGNLVLLKTGYVSTLSKDGKTLAVYNTSVQIYKKELDGSWNESGNITTDSGVTSMAFTSDGRYIIIGSSSYLTIGIVRVYERTDSSENGWEQFGFEIYGVDYLGYFGHGVGINDDATRIIISAPESNTNSGTILKAGSLKIFDLQDNFWIQNTQVIEGISPFELLGTSVSMSRKGDIIAIGSPGYVRTTVSGTTLTTSNVGKTSVYRYRDNVWGLMGNNIEDGTIEKRNAYSISLSTEGNSIAVGSESGGGVRVYNFRGEDWRPLGSQISGTFGKSVSLSGNTVVIGSEDVDNGRVHIYNFTDGDWSRAGRTFEKTIVAEGGTNNMGKNVNITSDGTSICVTSQSDVRIYSI